MTGPFADHADDYVAAGWLPIPLGEPGVENARSPVPTGATGWKNIQTVPDLARIERWKRTHAVNNIGIRMPLGVLGLDVDDYIKSGRVKTGASQLAELEAKLGPLPPAPRSTSRGPDNPSGIRFFRVPEGFRHRGDPAADIDSIQHGWRYAAVAGSRHEETGRSYEWFSPAGRPIRIPRVPRLRDLPAPWLEFLTALAPRRPGSTSELAEITGFEDLEAGEVSAWLAAHGSGQACRAVKGVMRAAVAALEDEAPRDGSHYASARGAVYALVLFAVEGHRGSRVALRLVGEAYQDYIATVGRDPSEWTRMLHGAVSKAAAVVGDDWAQHGGDTQDCPDRVVAAGDGGVELWPSPADPLAVARRWTQQNWTRDGELTLRYWREDFYAWDATKWSVLHRADLRAALSGALADAVFIGGRAAEAIAWRPTAPKLKLVLEALADLTHRATCAEPDDLDALVDLDNGVLDLSTRVLTPHSPARFNLNALGYGWDPGAGEAVAWLAFLDSVWPGEEGAGAIALLRQWMGYVLCGDRRQHKALLLVGPMRSGKGTIARVLTGLVGPAGSCAPSLSELSGAFGLEGLLGKTSAVMGDIRYSVRNAPGALERFLNITGGDAKQVERKNKTAVVTVLPVAFTLLSNSVPNFLDPSAAVTSRLLVLETSVSFLGREDIELDAKLAGESPAVLAWALAGYADLVAAGRFSVPERSAATLDQIAEDVSPVKAFLADVAVGGGSRAVAGAEIERGELYALYAVWCERRGRARPADHVFGQDLRSVAPECFGTGNAVRRDGRRVRLYYGIELYPDAGDVVRGRGPG